LITYLGRIKHGFPYKILRENSRFIVKIHVFPVKTAFFILSKRLFTLYRPAKCGKMREFLGKSGNFCANVGISAPMWESTLLRRHMFVMELNRYPTNGANSKKQKTVSPEKSTGKNDTIKF
jgi:hypothetical protein